MKRYILNQLVALDIAVNALTGGSPYSTISERAWHHRRGKVGRLAVRVIDAIFGALGEKEHCKNSSEGPDEEKYAVI